MRRSVNQPPLVVNARDGAVVVEGPDQPPIEVTWRERPAFYGRRTAAGTPMSSVAELVG
jgi:hypothetical protein